MLFKEYAQKTRQPWQNLFTRLSFAVVAICLVTLLAACGGGGTTANTSPSPTSATAPTPTPTSVSVPTPSLTPTVPLTPAPGLSQTIQITNGSSGSFGFSPVLLTVKVGTTITWDNVSSVPHTVTSDDGQTFDSGNVLVGGTFHFTFTKVGTFPYHCNIHPYMRAIINVVSA